ncbi:Serine rich adhesin for platelets [Schistosoma japonicum]|nr:Serine rich adhesin for platelets [Schistosoma japonicum]
MPHDGSDLMERIRQIVNQQKLRCLDENKLESSSISGLNLNDLMSDNHNKTEVSSKLFIRKVVEATAPSAYPGFSTITGDKKKTFTDDSFHKLSRCDAKSHILKRLRDTSPTNLCVKRVSAKNTCSTQVDSQTNAVPNNVNAWRQGKDLIKRYLSTSSESINKHADMKQSSPKLAHTSPLGFDSVIAKDNQKMLNLNQNELKTTKNSNKANGNLINGSFVASLGFDSVISKDQQKVLDVNRNDMVTTKNSHNVNKHLVENAPLIASKSKKGLFRPVKPKTVSNNHSDSPTSVQAYIRDCPTSRAHLKALVQQQREARKQEHKRQLEAEKEKRERIQRNLQATALAAAAAAAAKSPITPRKRVSEHSPAIPVGLFQPVKTSVVQLNSYSSEREQKLEELLRLSETQNNGTINNCTNSIRMNNCKQILDSNSTVMQQKFFDQKSCIHNLQVSSHSHKYSTVGFHNTLKTEVQVPIPMVDNISSRSGTGMTITHRPQTLKKRSLSAKGRNVTSYPNRLKTTVCDRLTEAALLDIKLSAQRMKHMLVVDSDNDDSDEDLQCSYADSGVNFCVPSYSSAVHRPTVNVWRRLEAVGASESELEEDHVCIIEDVKDENSMDHASENHPTSWKYSSAYGKNFHQTGIIHHAENVHAKNEFHSLIYNDPLRFASVHNRQQKIFHRERNEFFRSSQPQANRMEKVESRERNNADGITLPYSREINDKESKIVQSIVPGNTNDQSTNVEYVDLDHCVLSHPASSVGTKAHELFVPEDSSESQRISADHQKINTFLNRIINSSQPRLTPAALNLQLTAEMNYLESLSGSMQHVADMESLRQISAAQAECVSLAQLLKARESQTLLKGNNQVLKKGTPAVLVSPEAGRLVSGVHSPQFECLLKAAEEFDKIDRRLSIKASHLDSISYCSTESPSINSNITNEGSTQESVNGSISGSCANKPTTKSTKTISIDNVKSISEGAPTASDSSNESCHPFPITPTGKFDQASKPCELTIILSPKSNKSSAVAKNLDKKSVLVDSSDNCKPMESYDKVATNEVFSRKSSDQVISRRKKSKRYSRNENLHIKSIGIPTLNLCVTSPNSSCQIERNEKFNQVKYVLNKRVEALKSRRKNAEELLALSKNLELEEVEVVRLEREALNAIQVKRSALRASHFQLSNDYESEKCSKSSHYSKNSDFRRRRSNSHSPVYVQHSNYSHYSDELSVEEPASGKTNSEQFPAASLGESVSPLKSNRFKYVVSLNSNIGSECSTARTVSTATDLKYCKSDSDSNPSVSHSEKHHSHTSVNNYKLMSNQYSEKCTTNFNSENNDINRTSKDPNHLFSKADIAVETTPSLRNLSLDRTVTPTPRQLRQRSNSHDSGRRKRVTVPNSTDSLDEDCRVYGVGDDEPFSIMSANSHSDLSELESRIQALNSNLKKQESILCRINVEYKRVHKDRLARLESTLLKHRQLCTEIIANIKADLDVCKASICTEASDSYSKSVKKLVDVDNTSYLSPSKSLNKTLSNFDDNSVLCTPSKHTDKFASSCHILFTGKQSPNEDETEPDTLISVAEELVSPQEDTEDELKQLDLDDDIDRSTPVVAEHSPNSVNKTTTCSSDAESKQTINSDVSKSKQSLSPAHAESYYYPDVQPGSKVDNDFKSLGNLDILHGSESKRKFDNTSVKCEIGLTDNLLTPEHVDKTDVFSNQLNAESFINECKRIYVLKRIICIRFFFIRFVLLNSPSVNNITGEFNELTSNQIFSASPSGVVNEIGNTFVDDEKISIVTTTIEDFDNMVVSTDISIPSGKISLRKTASDHRQREELVDRITNELLNQLVSEAIDSMLNVRKTNFEIKTIENPASDDDGDDLLNDESLQKSSGSESSSDELIPLLDLGLKTLQDDEEKSLETVKSKICVTPEPSFTVENIQGLFADTPKRTQPLIHLAVKHFWAARLNANLGCEGVALFKASNNPPIEFGVDYYDEAVRFISRALLFDLISEIVRKIFIDGISDNDDELKNRPTITATTTNLFGLKPFNRVSSAQFRLWRGPCPPATYNQLLAIVTSEVHRELNLETESKSDLHNHKDNIIKRPGLYEIIPSGARFSRLVQWTLSKKSWLDRLLDLELRADEPTWLSYVPEEREIKMKLSSELWEDILEESLNSVIALNTCHFSK